MTNYDAILKMDPNKMAMFLNHVYLTGANDGIFSMAHEDTDLSELPDNPYEQAWLSKEADEATIIVYDDDGEMYLPDELAHSILRNAGFKDFAVEE